MVWQDKHAYEEQAYMSSQMRKRGKKKKKRNHPTKEVSEELPNDIYFASLALVTYGPAPIACLYLHEKLLILHVWNFITLLTCTNGISNSDLWY